MRGKRGEDCDIDLGLAISGAMLKPGVTRSANEIAAFCGCRRSAIQSIEKKALSKLRKRLTFVRDIEVLP